jgi:chitin disaccharide deacetylase
LVDDSRYEWQVASRRQERLRHIRAVTDLARERGGVRVRVVRLLVVNADDFGLSRGVNDGIVEAHTHGIVTSTSLMVLAPAAGEAARAAAEHETLSVGLHFVQERDTDLGDPAQVARSFAVQLERFRELVGRDPTHVDSHHHVHSSSMVVRATFAELVEPLGVPLRGQSGVAFVGAFWGQWRAGVTELRHVSRPFLLGLIASRVGEGITEIGCHPAQLGDFTSSYLEERMVELQTLTSPGLRAQIEASGVRLVNFSAWRR